MITIQLTDMLQTKILRACAGEVVALPYDDAQREATARLETAGLVRSMLVDDQPTTVITAAGQELLASLRNKCSPRPDYRFVNFMRDVNSGPSAMLDPRLRGHVVSTPNEPSEWKFENPTVQRLWECWQHGHEAGCEDAY